MIIEKYNFYTNPGQDTWNIKLHITPVPFLKKKLSDFMVKMYGGYDETIMVTEKVDTVGTFFNH